MRSTQRVFIIFAILCSLNASLLVIDSLFFSFSHRYCLKKSNSENKEVLDRTVHLKLWVRGLKMDGMANATEHAGLASSL